MRAVRSGVDLFDDGIFFLGVEIARAADDAVDVCFAITAFGDEAFGAFPTGLFECRMISLFEDGDQRAVFGASQFGDGREVDAGVGVDEKFSIGRVVNVVSPVACG